MIGKQAWSKANMKLVNGAAFQVWKKKATKWLLEMTLVGYANLCSVIISLASDFQIEGFPPERNKGMELQNSAQVHSKLRQGSCRASISRFPVDGLKWRDLTSSHMANGKQSDFHRLSCTETVLALLKLLKQICCLKRGKGYPGAFFAERLKVFQANRSI